MALSPVQAHGLPFTTIGIDPRLVWDRKEPDLVSPDAIERVIATTATGVELAVDEPQSVLPLLDARPRALPLLQSASLTPISLVADLLWRYNPATQAADIRGHALRVLRDLCRVAADYGIPTVVALAGMQESGVPYEATYAAAIQTLRLAAHYATDQGVAIAVENAPTNFLQSPREFALFIRDLGSPAISACINLSHVLVARQTFPENWIQAVGEHLALVRAYGVGSIDRADGPDAATLDWPSCLAALRAVGYGGALTLGLGPPQRQSTAAPGVRAVAAAIRSIRDFGESIEQKRGASP